MGTGKDESKTKVCPKCKALKFASDFVFNNKAKDKLSNWCKVCQAAQLKAWREKNPERKRLNDRRLYLENRTDRIDYNKERQLRLRKQVVEAYGGRCNCCAESRFEFLAVDHTDNDGAEERKRIKGNGTLHSYIIEQGFPARYQVLCHNCNLAKSFTGKCPHQTEREEQWTILAQKGGGLAA